MNSNLYQGLLWRCTRYLENMTAKDSFKMVCLYQPHFSVMSLCRDEVIHGLWCSRYGIAYTFILKKNIWQQLHFHLCCRFQCIALNLVEKAARIYHCTIAFKQTSKIKRKLGLCNWNYLYGDYHNVVITSWNCLVNKLF